MHRRELLDPQSCSYSPAVSATVALHLRSAGSPCDLASRILDPVVIIGTFGNSRTLNFYGYLGGHKETEVLKWNSKFLLKCQTLDLT